MAKKPTDWEKLLIGLDSTPTKIKDFLKDGNWQPAGEVVNALRLSNTVIQSNLRIMVDQGVLQRDRAPNGKSGHRLFVYRLLPVGRRGGRDDRGTDRKAHGRVK